MSELPPPPLHDRATVWWMAFMLELAELLGDRWLRKPYAPEPGDGPGLYVSHAVRIVYRPAEGRDVVVQTDPLSGGLVVAVPPPIPAEEPEEAARGLARSMFAAIRHAKEVQKMNDEERTAHDDRPPDYAMPGPLGHVETPEGVNQWEHLDAVKRERMTRLCDCFPTLRGLPGTNPFNPDTLARQAGGSGLRHAVAFAVAVWSGGSFDASRALMAWDESHRAAFAAWSRAPWWC